MKNLRFFFSSLIVVVLFCLNSCGSVEPLDPSLINANFDSGTTAEGAFKVDFDGKTFIATTVQALVNDNYISISGVRTPNGDLVQITLPFPYNKVGTYTWKSVSATGEPFVLAYIPSNGAESFFGIKKDDSLDLAGYTDTASITISKIDVVNHKISGIFQFTGVKISSIIGASPQTKVFANGSFADIPFEKDIPVPVTNNSFSAKLDGVIFSPIYINAVSMMGKINIIARKGTVETMGITFPSTVTTGTYDLNSFSGDYIAEYIKNSNLDGSGIFGADVGTITITSHDMVNKKVVGTFKFTANSFIVSETHNITEGAFSVSY